MARLVLNRDGGKTDEFGHILGLSRFLNGEVIEGLEVTAQSSPNMTVKVSAGSAKIPYGTGGTRYDYWVANDADYSVTISTADPANPRIDYIIGVVDRTVTPSTAVTNNSNAMFKIIAVAGTPAASPSVPSGTQLQTAAGTGNPYILLRRVNVPAGVTQITSGQISTDLRVMAYAQRIADDSVETAKIKDSAVTSAKVASNAITRPKIDFSTFTNVVRAYRGTGSVSPANPYNFPSTEIIGDGLTYSSGTITTQRAFRYIKVTMTTRATNGASQDIWVNCTGKIPLRYYKHSSVLPSAGGVTGSSSGVFLDVPAGAQIRVDVASGTFIVEDNQAFQLTVEARG